MKGADDAVRGDPSNTSEIGDCGRQADKFGFFKNCKQAVGRVEKNVKRLTNAREVTRKAIACSSIELQRCK